MGNQTPETIRAAAYLATRERLDARKTSRNVQCNPPNIRCGNRCIPPTWDCRLKGQGTDPHLRAVKTDPLGGLANIQRGFGRIAKGIAKGSFSDVEGGKRSIIRGTVKITPGNIQQKKELAKKLENRTRAIGMGLAVVTGGLGIHALLMNNDTFGYRNGLGKQINESVHTGVSRVLDATPLLGAQRARTRVGAFSSITEAVTRSARAPQAGPDGLIGGLDSNSPETLRHLQNLGVSATERSGNSNLTAATQAVNKAARASGSTNVYAWNEQHQQAFWTAKKRAPDLDSYITELTKGKATKAEISVFARPASEDFLIKHYNLPIEKGGSNASATSIKDALANKLIEEREMHVAYAKQLGLKTAKVNKEEVIHPDAINTYLSKLNKNAGITGSGTVSKTLGDSTDSHVASLMNSKSLSVRASEIYAESLYGFSKLYDEVGGKVTNLPGVASLGSERKIAPSVGEGTQTLLASLDRVRVGEMARELGFPRNQIAGEAHAELVRSAYFANRVVRDTKTNRAAFAITDRLALSAASELAGRPITQSTEAFRVLQSEHGFSGATRVQSARSSTTTASAPAARTPRSGLGRQAAISSLAREIRARAGNEGMSLEAAYRAAKREIEQRGDSHPELVRTATYLAARVDFQKGKRLGKPCGASHIPKAHECRKEGGASASPPSSDTKHRAITIAAVAGGALAIGVAGSVAYNLKTLSDPTKSPLDPSPSIKDLVKSMKQEAGTKSASEAMGHYYTKKSGLKPGDVVYFRHEKDPAAHFGIYLGEGKDGIVRAVIANTNKSRFSWTDVAEIGATKPGIKTSQALMTPLVKAPDPKFKQSASSFSNEDVVRRAIRIANTDYKFSLTRDNCEALANGIAYGVPESEQLQRFRRATRAVVDVGVSRGQRREAREAIYQGRAQGRSYTAHEFVTFLEGQREFSSPASKELAKQYAQYFQNSRLDAANARSGLITPDELWSRIKSYGPAVKAQAMADYLLIQRSLLELDGPA